MESDDTKDPLLALKAAINRIEDRQVLQEQLLRSLFAWRFSGDPEGLSALVAGMLEDLRTWARRSDPMSDDRKQEQTIGITVLLRAFERATAERLRAAGA